MKINIKNLIIFALLVGLLIVGISMYSTITNQTNKLTYNNVLDLLNSENVRSFDVSTSGTITITVAVNDSNGNIALDKDGKEKTKEYSYTLQYSFQYEEINEIAKEQYEKGILTSYNYEEPAKTNWFLTYLPYILVLVGFVILVFMMTKATQDGPGRGYTRANVKAASASKNPVRFSDVAGADEEKEELEEVVEFLKNPQRYIKMGAKIPRGVLLVGPPGTGKTLLAKAVAGEANVPFYSISGSDFVELYVGVGASRVRDLFNTARKSPASIIFIDEIDAVGRHRGAGLGGGHDEREQTLNQLLVEMDGFSGSDGVIVIAATNRPDILDPALLRPGRFDRQITVNYPDMRGREEILKVHIKNKPLGSDVDLHRIAQTTVGFTGADLANLMNEAALLAARRKKVLIGMQEVEDATLKVLVGTEKKNKIMSERERKNTAYHEAGHAVLAHIIPGLDPVTRISIIPSSKGALGYTLTPPQADQYSEYKKVMEGNIAMTLGGRIAEQLIFDDYTGGASQDIKQATKLARKMVTVYGMSDRLGPVCLAGEHSQDEVFLGRDFSTDKNYSEETAAIIDQEIHRIIDEAYKVAKGLLEQHLDKLHLIVRYLLEYEVMDADIFNALMDNGATFEELCEMKKQKDLETQAANERAARENAERERQEALAKESDAQQDEENPQN